MKETPEERSRVMRQVKSQDTSPELRVRKLLHGLGYRYRLHRRGLPGTPDIVFPARRKVIFVHGCFWHGHGCKRGARTPKTNRAYWEGKIGRNRDRHERSCAALAEAGWRVLTVWECEIRDTETLTARLTAFLDGSA